MCEMIAFGNTCGATLICITFLTHFARINVSIFNEVLPNTCLLRCCFSYWKPRVVTTAMPSLADAIGYPCDNSRVSVVQDIMGLQNVKIDNSEAILRHILAYSWSVEHTTRQPLSQLPPGYLSCGQVPANHLRIPRIVEIWDCPI